MQGNQVEPVKENHRAPRHADDLEAEVLDRVERAQGRVRQGSESNYSVEQGEVVGGAKAV